VSLLENFDSHAHSDGAETDTTIGAGEAPRGSGFFLKRV
jgi:hypothetical protein